MNLTQSLPFVQFNLEVGDMYVDAVRWRSVDNGLITCSMWCNIIPYENIMRWPW